jgi:hypothetical protein
LPESEAEQIHASRLDLYPKAGCGSAKFGRLKHDGCIQPNALIQLEFGTSEWISNEKR